MKDEGKSRKGTKKVSLSLVEKSSRRKAKEVDDNSSSSHDNDANVARDIKNRMKSFEKGGGPVGDPTRSDE
jgi:hypothetical protein